MAGKPFLPIGCNSSEFGTADPRLVSMGGSSSIRVGIAEGRGLQKGVHAARREGGRRANA